MNTFEEEHWKQVREEHPDWMERKDIAGEILSFELRRSKGMTVETVEKALERIEGSNAPSKIKMAALELRGALGIVHRTTDCATNWRPRLGNYQQHIHILIDHENNPRIELNYGASWARPYNPDAEPRDTPLAEALRAVTPKLADLCKRLAIEVTPFNPPSNSLPPR